jgi:hypothetical protein
MKKSDSFSRPLFLIFFFVVLSLFLLNDHFKFIKTNQPATQVAAPEMDETTKKYLAERTEKSKELNAELLKVGYGTSEKKLELNRLLTKRSDENTKDKYDDKNLLDIEEGEFKKYIVESDLGDPWIEVLGLRLPSWDSCYIFFYKVGGHWQFVDLIDVFDKYHESNMEVLRSGQEILFSISDSSGGSGVFTSWREVYKWDDGALKKVLLYPDNGYRNGWGWKLGNKFKTEQATIVKNPTGVTISLPLSVDYSGDDCDDQSLKDEGYLFSEKIKVDYHWDAVKKLFYIDPKFASENHDETIAGIFDADDVVFSLYFEDFKKLAQRKNVKLNQWLNCFLSQLETKSEKTKDQKNELLKFLNEKLPNPSK